MKYTISAKSDFGKCEYVNETVHFTASGSYSDARFFLDIDFEDWEEDCYVFIPACAYNGNRARYATRAYPPMYLENEIAPEADPVILRAIPSIGIDGKSTLECSVADAASPIIGIFNRHKKEAFFLFTEQQIKDKNIGYNIQGNRIRIQFSLDREIAYRFIREPDIRPDKGISVEKDEELFSKVLIRCFACEDVAEFFRIFFSVRKLLMCDPRPKNEYDAKLLKTMIDHFNDHNFSGEYYGSSQKWWMPGWCGGGMCTYPLFVYGDDLTKERAIKTLDFLVEHVSPAGYPYTLSDRGILCDDSKASSKYGAHPEYEYIRGAHLVRRSGDVLVFFIKQFKSEMPVKDSWISFIRNLADNFVKLFKQHGTFGQYVHFDTGELLVKKTACGASIIGGLAMAGEYFGCEKYLEIAKEAGEFYFKGFVSEGMATGGPSDCLTASDSESSYAFVESYIALYEITKDEKWLEYAKVATHLFSSWVMTYSYKFPSHTEFGIQGINTVGSVFANVQNKHSAPGICTFSGDAIYKLYKFTGNKEYLELIKDIAYFMPQCVSTDEHPIYDWDHKHGEPEGRLPNGFICERVNTSDWEYDKCVGGVFNVSCWPETCILLTFLELMDKDEMK